MAVEIIEQSKGPSVYVWEQIDGMWACCAGDHNAFCFLCQKADETLVSLIQHVREGNMICRAKPDGEFEFHVTMKGHAAAEDLIMSDPAMADMWAKLQANGSFDV